MHECPNCGAQTEGSWSEGGVKWAICDTCMEKERNHDRYDDRDNQGG